MDCDCMHENVCQYATPIREAMSKIMHIYFGPQYSGWAEVEAFVKKHCRFRDPRPEGNHKPGTQETGTEPLNL